MLNVMRKHAGSWMIKVILFAIVIVFVFWGVGSFRSQEASKVATVNGEIIDVAQYRRAYNNMIDQYRQRFGASLNDGMIEMLQVKRQTLNQLIDRTILLQEARKLGLRVSDAEVANTIMKTPIFQSNGSFDNRRYRNILARVNITPEEFEAEQKNVLLGEKLTRIIVGAAKVSEAEARLWYDWQNASVNIDYVLFDPSGYNAVAPTEKEITDYFEAHKENYTTDPKIKARYVTFDPKTYIDRVTVEEDEIADYYDSNADEFKTETSVEARHILIKVDPDADEATDRAAKSKAQEITDLANAGQDFAELAKTYSQGPTKDRGGYLGKFQHSQMVKPFADKAFSMQAGEISQPVRTQFGWHVIKVESVEEATTKTLEESKKKIIGILTDRKTRNLAYDDAEKIYESSFEKDDLIKNAQAFGLSVEETEPFSRQGPDALGPNKAQFANAAFALKLDEISDIEEIGGRYYLIQVTEIIDAVVPPLEAVQDRVKADLTKQMQTDMAKQAAEAMATDLKAGNTFETSATAHGTAIQQTGLFNRNAAIPTIGSDANVTAAAFQLPTVGSVNDEPVEGSAGFYLLRLKERKAPAADGFEAEIDSIKERLLRQKQRTLIQDWIDARKAEGQITIETAFLE